jgi:multimeric flavodoxin WrbA
MKALVITGSPRRNGNTTIMGHYFAKSLKEKGYKTNIIDAAFLKIGGCLACNNCYKSAGKPCCFDDDFNKIVPLIEEADVIAFAFPVWWYSIPNRIKALIDKLYAEYNAKKFWTGKKIVLFSCAEEEDPAVFTGVKFAFEETVKLMEGVNAGEILLPSLSEEEQVKKTDAFKKIDDLIAKLN